MYRITTPAIDKGITFFFPVNHIPVSIRPNDTRSITSPQKPEKKFTTVLGEAKEAAEFVVVILPIPPMLFPLLAFFDKPTAVAPITLKLINIVHMQIPIPPAQEAHLLKKRFISFVASFGSNCFY